jgi:hypothetical protein
MEQKEILELYETLRYGNKQNACSRIARQCNRQPNSVRNWFCSWKRIPVKFEAITIKILNYEHAATDHRN